MNTRKTRYLFILPIAAVLLIIFGSTAWAFPTYTGCGACHGGFTHDDYTSLVDGVDWGETLMQGHGDFLQSRCSACHGPGSQDGVFLNSSNGNNYSKGCVGCHGRQEDVTGNCVGGGGVQVECGAGAGLRKYHELKVGIGTCTSCHTFDGVPVGEHVNPQVYGLANSLLKNSCDADGTERQFGPTGLDNDGDGQRDADDPDCQESVFTINAGLNDAWVSAGAALQGFFITVFDELGAIFISWFTFDSILPPEDAVAIFGAKDHRWVTGLGFYTGNTVTINVELTSGGIFHGSVPLASQASNYGTITIEFISCTEAILTYNFPGLGLSGQMTITRVLPDNVALCEAMSES